MLSLERMHKGNQKWVFFNPLSGNIVIKLSEKDGQISVNCGIMNDTSTGKLEFNYDIDQSFIPELVKDIKSAIEEQT